MVENFLPKLSQNLLDVLNDEEFYDITIEVEIFQIILRYIYGDPDSKPISKTRHHKTNDNLFLTNNDKNLVTDRQAKQSVITKLMNKVSEKDTKAIDDNIIYWDERINDKVSVQDAKLINCNADTIYWDKRVNDEVSVRDAKLINDNADTIYWDKRVNDEVSVRDAKLINDNADTFYWDKRVNDEVSEKKDTKLIHGGSIINRLINNIENVIKNTEV
ncbi:unnamed protein product [Rhizophagus irregularis]|nr:unnamed protein product [Rhizophagus irregularis]